MVNLPTLHRRRVELCRAYFAKMKSSDHNLNALVPNGRSVPYALRLCNKLSIPRANRASDSYSSEPGFESWVDVSNLEQIHALNVAPISLGV